MIADVKDTPMHLIAIGITSDILNMKHLFALIADRAGDLPCGNDGKLEQVISAALAGCDMCRRAEEDAEALEGAIRRRENGNVDQ